MGKVSYKDQLADARWQKKKCEILNRDNFTCCKCGIKSNLNVHHISYDKGKLAWEYPNENFITLCKECHEYLHWNQNISLLDGINKGDWYFTESGDFRDIAIIFDINYTSKTIYLFGSNEGAWGSPNIYPIKYIDFIKKWDMLDIFNEDEDGESFASSHYFLSAFTRAFDELMKGNAYIYEHGHDFSKVYAQHYVDVYIQKNEFLKDYCDFNNIKYGY